MFRRWARRFPYFAPPLFIEFLRKLALTVIDTKRLWGSDMLRNPKLCSQNRRNLPRLPVRKHQSSDLYISTILFLLSLFPIFFLLFHHLQHTFLFYPHTVLIWRVARSSPPDINRNTPSYIRWTGYFPDVFRYWQNPLPTMTHSRRHSWENV